MMMTDPISDMLTRMRNSISAGKKDFVVPFSNLKLKIAEILKKTYYIEDFKIEDSGDFKVLNIKLKYVDGVSAITSIKRVSKPGKKVYCNIDKMPVVLNGLGVAIISTNKGLMTNIEAKKKNIAGEIICEIY
ncbi:30S ribosomal protein S8 [bacterium]|nr:30S ribosomal protein S8 [bacterium]